MKLTKYNPFAPLNESMNFIDNFFNRTIGDFVGSDVSFSQPSVNVVETDENYKLEVAAPGLDKNDFEVKIENDYLTVMARKERKEEVKEENYTRREFNFASFSRSFRLPESVNADKIKANYENGVLLITLPKIEVKKEKKGKVIEIK